MSNRRREGTGGHLAGDWQRLTQDVKKEQIPEEKGKGCCAACVIYAGMSGSVNGGEVEQLEVLREYRDNVLMQDEIGRRFVDWYYNGGGEKMAEFVRGRGKFLVPIIKKGLDFIVEDYKRRRT